MTERHAGYLVTLDHDIREDDAAAIIEAIRMIRFVADVTPVVTDFRHQVIANRRDAEWARALIKLVQDGPGAGS